jgi:hypothetical protein
MTGRDQENYKIEEFCFVKVVILCQVFLILRHLPQSSKWENLYRYSYLYMNNKYLYCGISQMHSRRVKCVQNFAHNLPRTPKHVLKKLVMNKMRPCELE